MSIEHVSEEIEIVNIGIVNLFLDPIDILEPHTKLLVNSLKV